jgi:hypothetical protein
VVASGGNLRPSQRQLVRKFGQARASALAAEAAREKLARFLKQEGIACDFILGDRRGQSGPWTCGYRRSFPSTTARPGSCPRCLPGSVCGSLAPAPVAAALKAAAGRERALIAGRVHRLQCLAPAG